MCLKMQYTRVTSEIRYRVRAKLSIPAVADEDLFLLVTLKDFNKILISPSPDALSSEIPCSF